ncbi:MAG: hypothetical protein WBV39_07355 [Rudaea sp.]
MSFALLMSAAGVAQATTFTVVSSDDPTPAGCTPTHCSLREAIAAANADTSAPQTIDFAIPGAGPHTLNVTSQLPAITRSTTIDGFSQAGTATNTNSPDQGGLNAVLQIEIVGAGGFGFIVGTSNGISVTVQGLAMHGFSTPIAGAGGNGGSSQLNVFGNYLGTTIDGASLGASPGNTGSDISCANSPIQIGGQQAWQRNLISGSGGAAISIGGPAIVEGNLIGTDASGTLPIANGITGNNAAITISTYYAPIRIGGALPASRNVISGNHTWAISVGAPSGIANHDGLEIKGNNIGTDWSGLQGLPNGYENPLYAQYGGGIQLANAGSDPNPATIGGFGAGEANLIAYNRGAGISVTYNTAGENFDNRGNAIHHNRGVGGTNVDIGAFGKTPNDADDADSGANGVQNYPEILSSSQSGDQLTVTYVVDTATTNATYPLRIDFYADVQGGSGELLAEDFYALSDAQQPRTVTLNLPAGAKAIPFVAAATDANGRSSEFSPAADVIFENDFE